MDWLKIRTVHIDYDFALADDAVFRAWIQAMSMTCALERIPTKEQLIAKFGEQTYEKLCTILVKNCTNLDLVLEKVMEDVVKYRMRKDHDRVYIRKYRKRLQKTACKTLRKTLRKPYVMGKNRTEQNIISSLSSTTPIVSTTPLNTDTIKEKIKYGEDGLVLLTGEEYKRLVAKLGEDRVKGLIEAMNNGIACRGYKYKSHYHAVLNWARNEDKRRGRGGENREHSSEGSAGGKFAGHETEV